MDNRNASLFQPIAIGKLELPNRLIKSATYECMNDELGVPTNDLIKLHTMIAQGGAGLTIVSYGLIDPSGKAFSRQLRLYSDHTWTRLQELVEAVHAAGGRVALQLMHGGRASDPELCNNVTWAPSPVRDPVRLSMPRELPASRIKRLIDAFAAAAERTKAAGFDAVQLHAAHGYLISQFLSPFTNRRDDEWGGDAQRRQQFLREVYQRVREAVGPDYPVMVKLNVTDEVSGGVEVPEVAQTVSALASWGADCIELSGGFCNEAVFYISRGGLPIDVAQRGEPFFRRLVIGTMLTLMKDKVAFEREAYFMDKALAVAKGVSIPISLVGGMRSRTVMQEVLQTGKIDLISLARPLIRDPGFPRKLQAGQVDASTCISCNRCVAELAHESRLHCYHAYPAGEDPYAGWLT
jgi:2,4-dienoyl-CoA reductase-like NADH-dependent reductase (Old Yellow Enzyme family)